jgi:hypothetical protein
MQTRSFVDAVFDAPSAAARRSLVRRMLSQAPDAAPAVAWLLARFDEIRTRSRAVQKRRPAPAEMRSRMAVFAASVARQTRGALLADEAAAVKWLSAGTRQRGDAVVFVRK